MKYLEFLNKGPFIKVEKYLEDMLVKAPKLPSGWVKFLVKINPTMTLIGAILSIFSGISWMVWSRLYWGWAWDRWLVMLLSGVMLLAAYRYLKQGKEMGIRIVLWVMLLGMVNDLLRIDLSSVLGTALGVYIVFQLKPTYKK